MKPQSITLSVSVKLVWLAALLSGSVGAATNLADSPISSTVIVPANVILDLSVEFPTAVGDAYYSNSYSSSAEYVGYFNPNFCYDYTPNTGGTAYTGAQVRFEALNGYFKPFGAAASHTCTGHWSGNFLNWVLTQTIDPLRKTVTGGARIVDETTATILQRAYQDSQGGGSNQQTKGITNAATVQGATPFSTWTSIYTYNLNTGLNFVFSQKTVSSSSGALAFTGSAGCASPNVATGSTSTSPALPLAANFNISESGNALSLAASCTGTSTITVKFGTGYNTPVNLSVSGLPSGVTGVFSPTSISSTNGTSTLTLTATGAIASGTYTVTVKGTKSSGSSPPTQSVTFTLTTTAAQVYSAQGAVQVCTSGELSGTNSEKEGNSYTATAPDGSSIAVTGRCRAYGSNYKPIGLMQKYAAESTTQNDTIRYAAMGYMLDTSQTATNQKLDGGVLRAKMKSVGPFQANPGQVVTANSAQEWSPTTGIFVPNPDTADATASGVTRSGVANYLNLFGFVPTSQYSSTTRAAYKVYDSVGELYYMATRYYRHLGNLSSHTTSASAITSGEATNDNFPVITAWDDPIAYSCSTNYIIGIGDIHTWNDANVPGSTLNGGYELADAQLAADTAVNAKNATNWIGNLENLAGYTGAGVVPGTSANNGSDFIWAANLGTIYASTSSSPNAGSSEANTCCNGNTYYMAGLAYDAHVRDIRPDITTKTSPVTVSTFWLDVMESAEYREKNQFWLTAKYGGFNKSDTAFGTNGYPAATNGTPATYPASVQNTPLPISSWNTAGYVDDHSNAAPDQYYQAAKPAKMAAGLTSAFAKINSTVPAGTSTALSLSSANITTVGNVNYVATYANDWSGDVVAATLNVSVTGNEVSTTSTPVWDAHNWLPPTKSAASGGTAPAGVTPLTASTRIIATSKAQGAGQGVAFTMAGIGGTAQAAMLGASAAIQTSVLNYIRGDQCNEATVGTTLTAPCSGTSLGFHARSSVLGDVTNSKPAVVGAPNFPYADAPLNPFYSTFKSTYTNADGSSKRGTTVYIGANDGMLHAFDGKAASTGGKELFAYVPSALLTTNTDATGNPVGIASIAANPLQHHFLVDGQPVVYDIDFNRVGTGASSVPSTSAADWRSVLVGGLGKGGGSGTSATTCANGLSSCVGGGYYALDVTDPTVITSETALAGKVLWEIDQSKPAFAQMGYSYGEPLVVKTKKYGWTIVLTSGYGNSDGKGYIFLVNPKDGSLYESVSTSTGSPASPLGLAHVAAYVNNYADYTADALYAGDLQGNVWRVDLSDPAATLTMENFATLTDPSGAVQPVTTKPTIGTDPITNARYVFIGTGRLLADTDLVNPQIETFYGFVDGTNDAIDVTSSFPITRSNLASDYSAGAVTGVSLASKRGLYIDLAAATTLGAGTQASAERVDIDPVASGGVVTFAANLQGQDVCSKGTSRVFALSYATSKDASGNSIIGTSVLQNSSVPATGISFLNYSGLVTGLSLTTPAPPLASSSVASGLMLMVGLDTTSAGAGAASASSVAGDLLKSPAVSLTRLNWREIPAAQ